MLQTACLPACLPWPSDPHAFHPLQHDVDSGGQPHGSVHDQAGLLKMFLRALPDPLFTFRFYTDFIDAYKLPVRGRSAPFL